MITLTASSDAGTSTPSTDGYCVQGNMLYFIQDTSQSDAGVTGDIVLTIVGTKQ
jgi:hypothetical protein